MLDRRWLYGGGSGYFESAVEHSVSVTGSGVRMNAVNQRMTGGGFKATVVAAAGGMSLTCILHLQCVKRFTENTHFVCSPVRMILCSSARRLTVLKATKRHSVSRTEFRTVYSRNLLQISKLTFSYLCRISLGFAAPHISPL